MSKMLTSLALLPLRTLVGTYTVGTLPFYYLYQRPWQKLKLASSFGVKSYRDSKCRTIYFRPPQTELKHPYYQYSSFNEVARQLDPNKKAVGVRKVLNEYAQVDENGNPMKIYGKQLVKVQLDKEFQWYTVQEVTKRVDAIARAFKKMGIDRGVKVMIYADNSPEWFYAAVALVKLNAVVVTLFSTLNDAGVVFGMNQSEARFVITSENLLGRLVAIEKELEHVEGVVYIPNPIQTAESEAKLNQRLETLSERFRPVSFVDMEKYGERLPEIEFELPNPDDVGLIMYTSGTTGNPKGVMITHKNTHITMQNMLKMDEEFDFLVFNMGVFSSYLPMAHLFGYLTNFAFYLTDTALAFCSPFTLLDSSPAHVPGQTGDINLVRPQVLFVVPLVLERIVKEIYRKLNARSPIAAPIFTYLMDYKIRWTQRGYDTPIINRLVCQKINNQFGGRLKILGVSSAPLHERTQELATAALNVKLFQAYGATEVTAGSHAMHVNDISIGRSGVPYDSVKFYLKDWPEGGYSNEDKPNPRGEIVVGGDTVAQGYYKLPEETKEAFLVDDDGTRWFVTGDIGEIFPDGTIKIIDRKKDLTKLGNGEFISLGKIESGLRASKFVENICICSSPFKDNIVAVISPNRPALLELANTLDKAHLSVEELCQDQQIIDRVLHSIKHVCTQLGFHSKETPTLLHLAKEEWTPDNNLLTAAFKMKRKNVHNFYKAEIDNMFGKLS